MCITSGEGWWKPQMFPCMLRLLLLFFFLKKEKEKYQETEISIISDLKNKKSVYCKKYFKQCIPENSKWKQFKMLNWKNALIRGLAAPVWNSLLFPKLNLSPNPPTPTPPLHRPLPLFHSRPPHENLFSLFKASQSIAPFFHLKGFAAQLKRTGVAANPAVA